MQNDITKLIAVVMGNGKAGLKDDLAQTRRDMGELREAIFEQDELIRGLKTSIDEKNKAVVDDAKTKRNEILKTASAAFMTILAAALAFANTYFLWRLTGHFP